MSDDIRLVEGSDVRVNCAARGCRRLTVMVMEGKQYVKCPDCLSTTLVQFTRKSDGNWEMWSGRP